jgi:hypothetical protein
VYDAIPWLELEGSQFAMGMPSPRTLKSHLPYHSIPGGEPANSIAKYIYIARNPKDVAVSLYYFTIQMKYYEFDGTWDRFFEHFMNGEVLMGSWFNHVLEWWKHKDANNILFLKYEDLQIDMKSSITKIAHFIGHEIDNVKLDHIVKQCTFDAMKTNTLANPDDLLKELDLVREGYSGSFLRKGIVGDWHHHFSEEQSLRLDEKYAMILNNSGLEFTYN